VIDRTLSLRDASLAGSVSDNLAFAVARMLLASAFLFSGTTKGMDFEAAAAEVHALTGSRASSLLAALVIAVQLGGAALLVAGGRAAALGALLLAGFTVVATIVAHDFWAKTGPAAARDATTFLEHAGLVGGFLLVAVLSLRRRGRP
jgi:transmembrane protein